MRKSVSTCLVYLCICVPKNKHHHRKGVSFFNLYNFVSTQIHKYTKQVLTDGILVASSKVNSLISRASLLTYSAYQYKEVAINFLVTYYIILKNINLYYYSYLSEPWAGLNHLDILHRLCYN